MATSDSVRYDEASEVKPSNSRKASTGSVIDPRSKKYPSTHELASSSEETHTRIKEGTGKGSCRRPGGMYRGAKHGFHGVHCYCGKHPCTCGNEKAHGTIIHDNVNM